MPKLFACLIIFFLAAAAFAQSPIERHQKIRAALDARNYAAAMRELEDFRRADARLFELNNYDYLLARTAEKRGDRATAASGYAAILQRRDAAVLRPYALWRMSQTMRASGNLNLERNYLEMLLTVAPDSLLTEPARMRLARSFFESGDYGQTVQSFKSQVPSPAVKSSAPTGENPNQKAKDREILTLIGQAHLRGGNKEKAREVFTQLLTNMPNPSTPDDYALAAARGLDEIQAAQPADAGKIAPVLPDHEHLRRALIYQFNRAFAEARLHYAAIVERYETGANAPDAILQLGRINSTEGKFAEAIPFFERVQAQFPTHPAARDAMLFEAAAFARSGNSDEAVARYQAFIEKFIEPGAEAVDNPERPYLNIVDALRDKGRDADALAWIERTRNKFRGELPATLALFSRARIHLSQENWNAALRDLAELETVPDLGGARIAGGTFKSEIAFLKAFALENLNRFDEAFDAYLAITDGRAEYYGGRATERLKAFAANPKTRDLHAARLNLYRAAATNAAGANDAERARQNAQNVLRLTNDETTRAEMLDIARRAYAVLPAYRAPSGEILPLGRQKVLEKSAPATTQNQHQTIADELLFLGLYDEAAPELEAVQSPKSKVQSPNSAADAQNPKSVNPNPKSETSRPFTLAVVFKRGDLAHKAVAYAEPLWRNVPADYLVELAPREAIELLYPAPYAESLLEFAPSREIDPRFALSIMRQESRYRADVKSIAAARGLMQFIPSTASNIARQLDQTDFAPNDLYNPPTAILFGSQYLQNIFKEFPAQPQAVAAAYNGGEANMLRWLVRSRATDADRYVAEIQFGQSKDYVFKVMANYRTYQTLYDERLRRR